MIATLLIAGLILILIEMWLPGLVAGIGGAIAWIIALVLIYVQHGAFAGNAAITGMALGGLILSLVWMRTFPETRLGKRFILSSQINAHSSTGDSRAPLLIGQKGVAVTPLHLSGAAQFDGFRTDVVAESDWIEAGQPLEILRIEGAKIVVRKVSTA
jgi:membrane-bound serine protease (ClpP class)